MEIAVKETYAHMLKDESLVQNSEKIYIVEFIFDQSWDGYTKTAVFKAGSSELSVPLTDDRCIIPAECLKQAGVNLHVGVNGVKGEEQKDTIWCLTSRIMYAVDATQLIPPAYSGGDIRAQILEVIRENTATDEEVDQALDEAFGTDWTPPDDPDDPEDPDNTATDEEVEDILDDVFGEEP